jgi:hypothetical protein
MLFRRVPRPFPPAVVVINVLTIMVILYIGVLHSTRLGSNTRLKPHVVDYASTSSSSSSSRSIITPHNDEYVYPAATTSSNESPSCAAASRRSERPGYRGGPLIHLVHVPKAAGSAMRALFREWTTRANISMTETNDQQLCQRGADLFFGGHPEAEKLPLSGVYAGHVGYGLSEDLRGRSNALFTVLAIREPIARFTSYINYLKRHRRAPAEWMDTRNFDAILWPYVNYTGQRIKTTSTQLPVSFELIRAGITDQLSLLASYKCVFPTSESNPFGCALRQSEDEMCSMANMKRMAMDNVRKADMIVDANEFDVGLTTQAAFHLPFAPRIDEQLRRRSKLLVNGGNFAFPGLVVSAAGELCRCLLLLLAR